MLFWLFVFFVACFIAAVAFNVGWEMGLLKATADRDQWSEDYWTERTRHQEFRAKLAEHYRQLAKEMDKPLPGPLPRPTID